MPLPIGINPQSTSIPSTCLDMVITKKQEYMASVENLLYQVFENEEVVKQAVADNRILRVSKTYWNPIEEEIYLDGQKIAEFKITFTGWSLNV